MGSDGRTGVKFPAACDERFLTLAADVLDAGVVGIAGGIGREGLAAGRGDGVIASGGVRASEEVKGSAGEGGGSGGGGGGGGGGGSDKDGVDTAGFEFVPEIGSMDDPAFGDKSGDGVSPDSSCDPNGGVRSESVSDGSFRWPFVAGVRSAVSLGISLMWSPKVS